MSHITILTVAWTFSRVIVAWFFCLFLGKVRLAPYATMLDKNSKWYAFAMITRHDTRTQTRSLPVRFRCNFRQKNQPEKFLLHQKNRRKILGGVSRTIF